MTNLCSRKRVTNKTTIAIVLNFLCHNCHILKRSIIVFVNHQLWFLTSVQTVLKAGVRSKKARKTWSRNTFILNCCPRDDALSYDYACWLFLHTFSICLQQQMRRRRAEAPPVVHFMLQTNRKSVQRKSTSPIITYCIVSGATVGNQRVKLRAL